MKETPVTYSKQPPATIRALRYIRQYANRGPSPKRTRFGKQKRAALQAAGRVPNANDTAHTRLGAEVLKSLFALRISLPPLPPPAPLPPTGTEPIEGKPGFFRKIWPRVKLKRATYEVVHGQESKTEEAEL